MTHPKMFFIAEAMLERVTISFWLYFFSLVLVVEHFE